jgi:hypothetical protein
MTEPDPRDALERRARELLADAVHPQSKTRRRLLADRDWRDTAIAIPTVVELLITLLAEGEAQPR